jgi:hypothetical protein
MVLHVDGKQEPSSDEYPSHIKKSQYWNSQQHKEVQDDNNAIGCNYKQMGQLTKPQ